MADEPDRHQVLGIEGEVEEMLRPALI
jgi:hypothetical protein